MSLLPVGSAESSGYDINNSLRFRSSATAFLSRTPATASNRTTWTWSGWVKRGTLGTEQFLFTGGDTNFNDSNIRFNATNTLTFFIPNGSSATAGDLTTNRVFRDPSAWYHIVVVWNSTSATAADRMQIWINGVRETSFAVNTNPPQNQISYNINAAVIHNIGRKANGATSYFDGYIAEINFIDGQALSASSFGSTNSTTGVWQPAKYTGTYGTNGFYLPFTDNTGTSRNYLNYSQLIGGTGWSNNTLTAGTNNVVAPDGSTTASTLTGAGGDSYTTQAFTSVASTTYTFSVWLKSTSNISVLILAGPPTWSITTCNLTTSWQRFSVTFTANGTTSQGIIGGGGSITSGTVVHAWGAQVNDGSTATPYYSTTASAQASTFLLGRDYSSGGYNNWVSNNLSLTAGVTYDSMTDVPTLTSPTVGNYCVLNNIALVGTATTNGSTSNANLTATTAAGSGSGVGATMAVNMPSGNKWYWEVTLVSGVTAAANACQLGVVENSAPDGLAGTVYAYNSSDSPTYTNGDTISFAYDGAASILYCYKNNVLAKTVTSVSSSAPLVPLIRDNLSPASIVANFNFGQRPFTYTPPAGYVRLNTFNLPTSTIVKGNTVMDATTYTGTGIVRSVTNTSAFKPDFVWIKSRSSAGPWHNLYDSVRGVTKQLFSNATNAENTDANSLTSFNTNGFSLGIDTGVGNYGWNTNAVTYVGWQWQAGQGTNTTNTSGSITSTVSVNATAGFSIATFTTPSSGGPWTIGHGLGVAPKLIIAKSSSAALSWVVYHTSTGNTVYTLLNSTGAVSGASSAIWNNTSPTSTVFTMGATSFWGASATYLAYCWSEIAGFSNFGSYIGNGNADGPFVYTGFRPKFVLYKRTNAVSNWFIFDSTRNTTNLTNLNLYPNLANAEATQAATDQPLDLLSNGFKLRGTGGDGNASGSTYIYMAFAENPFKNALAR